MASWTLTYDGTTKTLEEWGADASSTLTLQNQTVGVLALYFPGLADADVPFAYKGKVVLKLDDEVIFRGIAMEPNRSGDGETEGITIQFVDAWWYFTNGTLTQTIYDRGQSASPRTGTLVSGSPTVTVASTTGLTVGVTVAGTGIPDGTTLSAIGTGEITLSANATVDGDQTLRFLSGVESNLFSLFALLQIGQAISRRTIAQTLSDIIVGCNAHHGGGVMQFGACYGDGFTRRPQPVDVNGTFETGIRTVLGFVPDAVPFIDPTTDPPTFYFYQRSAATVQSLAYADGRVMMGQAIRERKDLLINGVRIIYRRYLADGTPATFIDQAGETAGPGVVQAEMQLYAPTSVPRLTPGMAESQWLKSEPVEKDDKDWWFKNARLGVETKDDILIIGVGTKIELDPEADENDGITDLDNLDGCDRRIVEGSIPAWLSDEAHLRYVRVVGYLTLQIWNNPDDHTLGKKKVQRRTILSFAATDLGTNLYENLIRDARMEGGSFDPEIPPSGVAAAVLAAQSVLQYEGSVTLTDDECAVDFAPGQVMNVTGSAQTSWTTMNAQIQSVQHKLHAGTSVISFGPAEHLSPQDYLEITRRLMRWKPSLDLAARVDTVDYGGGGDGIVHHPSTQPRFGITQTDNVIEKKDVDGTGSIERTTVSGKQVWSNGTTTITVDCSGNVISITGAGSKQIILDLDTLPASAVAQFQLIEICVGGVAKTAYVLMTTPA